jgi:rare lipoprotein A (peptidoglycan hydrolase)
MVGSIPRLAAALMSLALVSAACTSARRESIATTPAPDTTVTPDPADTPRAVLVGIASWYGEPHHGRKTASGEPFNMHALTAAHRTLPLGTRVRVTNLANGRVVEVRINDRGPSIPNRIIDLSYAAARALEAVGAGVFRVRIAVLE